ncbi:MAG: methionine--tRNA ligase [Saprospiraceae bacterium]|nr:methionine--tRNA ligase [Saprospiraceae bacterium]MCF8248434.1 methionine--tRNA ligase [Saprospiraceae bacterium]MCF8309962.1 methionine--tRNA ligase [Saprospiraceae bacterium]MCF8438707.1 methionine--tRNA ligase [Saprospiraceae bacterium]
MDKSKKYCVTSALPYANGALHLGHLAGAYLPADIYVRYLRGLGCDVIFICGSDEHGAAITIRAKKDGISPREIIDKYHALNKATFEQLGISFDHYDRTSAPLHHETAQAFFKKLIDKGGELEERLSEQYFDEEYQQFLADRYIMGECPNCANPEAYGDQCERCGTTLSPLELKNPKSMLSGATPILKETSHWYFRLDKHGDWLREWIKTGKVDGQQHHDPKAWKNHVVGQCLSWLDDGEGLQPRSITRDLDWGIPVPMPGAEGKVLYVWFDAPIGYISSTKQWAADNGKNWEDYWKGDTDKLQLVHFIGKDNIVFHCIVFPAMLKAHGDYALPVNVPANQFLNFEGRKFSKSKGWGIEQHEYLEEFANFPNKEDALRWALIRNLPENKDADFKWDEFVDFYDKDLADKLGNFINRVITLTNSYYGGVLPLPPKGEPYPSIPSEIVNLVASMSADIEAYNLKAAASTLVEIASWGNQYLQDTAPWAIRKTDPDSPVIAECISTSLQLVNLLAVLCEPFIPFTSVKIRRLLNLPPVQNGDLEEVIAKLKNGEALLPAGHQIGQPEILFAKINDRNDKSRLEIIERQKAKLEVILANETATQPITHHQSPVTFPPMKEEIQYDDFAKMDIRTATITAAERIPKADKLLKLTVDLGFEQRTVVSGIAEQFTPEEVIGQRVLLLANLAPRKLRGVESQGMILMAENADGKLSFVQAGEAFGPGLGVK